MHQPLLIHPKAEVIPAVVVQKWLARTRALILNIVQKCAAKLTRRRNAHHTPKTNLVALTQREAGCKSNTRTLRLERIATPRKLHANVDTPANHRAARRRPRRLRRWNTHIHELKTRERGGLLATRDIDALSYIPAARAQRCCPMNGNAPGARELRGEHRCPRCVDRHRISDQLTGTRRYIEVWVRLEVGAHNTLARGSCDIETGWLIPHTDQYKVLALLPDHGDGRCPGHPRVAPLRNPRGHNGCSFWKRNRLHIRCVRWTRDDKWAHRHRGSDIGNGGCTHRAIRGVAFRLRFEVHFSNANRGRLPFELAAREACEVCPRIAIRARRDHNTVFQNVYGDESAFLVDGLWRRGRNAEAFRALLEVGALRELVGHRCQRKAPTSGRPRGGDHAVFKLHD